MRARATVLLEVEIASVLQSLAKFTTAFFRVSSPVARGADEADSSVLLFQRARRANGLGEAARRS